MAKKLTHGVRMGIYMRVCMLQVMEVLGWSEERWCNYVFDCGMMYLAAHLDGDQAEVQRVAETKAFWSWWRMHWMTRDREWLMAEQRRVWSARRNAAKVLGIEAVGETDNDKVLSACFGRFGNGRQVVQLGQTKDVAASNSYKELHNPHLLAEGMGVYGKVLEDSYGRDLIKEVNNG